MVIATRTYDDEQVYVHGRLTYNGDVTETFDPLKPYGPSTTAEMYWFVSASYDATTNKTTALFTQVPPDEFLKQMGRMVTK